MKLPEMPEADRIEHRRGAVIMLHGPESDLCRRLANYYPGIEFHEVVIGVLGPCALERFAADDFIEVGFTVTGAAPRLLLHGFAKPSWFRPGALTGNLKPPTTDDYCWSIERTPEGYHITRARFADGLDKLCVVFRIGQLLPRAS